jgi:long-chain acyl-CoA synthetase
MWGMPLGQWIYPQMLETVPHGGGTSSVLDSWDASVQSAPSSVHLRYGGTSWSRREVDELARALAAVWQEQGIGRGDRVAVQLQNVPAMVFVVLAAWRLGAVVVPVNPMYLERELEHVLSDSGTVLLVCDDSKAEIASRAAAGTAVRTVLSVEHVADLAAAARGKSPAGKPVGIDEPALITYTSGTTGPAKGAVATHANVASGAEVYRTQAGVGAGSVILASAPLCHITGMIGHLAVSLLAPCELILMGRFDADIAVELIESAQVTFTIAALTAYRALLTAAARTPRDFGSLRSLYSGGAPVAPAVAAEVERVFGVPLGNAYGLTETTSIAHLTPLGVRGPVSSETGALSIGRPAPGTRAWIVDESGEEVPPGTPGELVVAGPGVVAGYWQDEASSRQAIRAGALHTGDVAIRDDDGWFYLIDRIKDQINASGYKVWPREVEDVLYEHPDVSEVAVVGVPDEYRGETVMAFVIPREGTRPSADDLTAFARERLASYKSPRIVQFVEELPKIKRRELRVEQEQHQ